MDDPVRTTRQSTRTRKLTWSWEIESTPDPQLALEQRQATARSSTGWDRKGLHPLPIRR